MSGWARPFSKCLWVVSLKIPNCNNFPVTIFQRNLFTLVDVVEDLHKIIGSQKVWRPSEFDRSELEQIVPKSQDELPPQKMSRSYGEAYVPIGADEFLRQKYLNHTETVRVGRLMEDLDAFAVWLCYRHLLNPKQKPGMKSPFSIVTALVDRINLTNNIVEADKDIKFTGRVSWTGKTSLESRIWLSQENEKKEWKEVVQANFVMVARDPLNRGSAFVNPVIPETEEEKQLFKEGELNTKARKEHSGISLLKVPPSEAERKEIHSLFISTLSKHDSSYEARMLPEGFLWMEDTEMTTTILCHPEYRNRSNKIFGGFIMRQALELAYINSFYVCRTSTMVQYVDDILFRRPVEIGDVMFFSSKVVFAEKQFLQVRVVADVLNPKSNDRYTTNVFQFTFAVPEGTENIRNVMPRTYSDAMLHLDGKRHFAEAMKHRKTTTTPTTIA